MFIGLDKLASAEVEVKKMQELLASMKPQLERAAEATAKMIDRITHDTVSIVVKAATLINKQFLIFLYCSFRSSPIISNPFDSKAFSFAKYLEDSLIFYCYPLASGVEQLFATSSGTEIANLINSDRSKRRKRGPRRRSRKTCRRSSRLRTRRSGTKRRRTWVRLCTPLYYHLLSWTAYFPLRRIFGSISLPKSNSPCGGPSKENQNLSFAFGAKLLL